MPILQYLGLSDSIQTCWNEISGVGGMLWEFRKNWRQNSVYAHRSIHSKPLSQSVSGHVKRHAPVGYANTEHTYWHFTVVVNFTGFSDVSCSGVTAYLLECSAPALGKLFTTHVPSSSSTGSESSIYWSWVVIRKKKQCNLVQAKERSGFAPGKVTCVALHAGPCIQTQCYTNVRPQGLRQRDELSTPPIRSARVCDDIIYLIPPTEGLHVSQSVCVSAMYGLLTQKQVTQISNLHNYSP